MVNNPYVEQLSPLDIVMPRTYIRVLLVFLPTEWIPALTQKLQRGIDTLSKQLPWLSGQVVSTTKSQGRLSLGIRYDPSNTPTLIDKRSVTLSYETLSSRGMPVEDLPPDVWPVPDFVDDALFTRGAPVFAASLFRFSDRAVGLCICAHHNAVDATGFSEVVRLWARNVATPKSVFSGVSHGRIDRLSGALLSDLQKASSLQEDNLMALHPEFSTAPPAMPEEFSKCTSRLFSISMHWINVLKELLVKNMPDPPTTNTLVYALVWTAITRVRMQHNPTLRKEASGLVTAVNGRRRIGESFSPAPNSYFGNVVLYSLTKLPAGVLATSDQDPVRSLATICELISGAYSVSKVNSGHIAEVYDLVDRLEDYRSLFVGWDLFQSRDLTITSWADLDLYDANFGASMGRPRYVRFPYMEADGVAIIMPRQRAARNEVLEIMIMLRRDHMALFENDSMWQTLCSME
ncbi:hypothetical protein FE257_003912 [Aspergillus nanangensis]|uniref:Uncharacterized protein n=1 Tax=Aspergillus nanangensis TaxID=2582783 RepID=A0AAD4GW38_ASPNN|nr:hypothetical protein FE257_003912 [Aspergillus nanangensis]